MINVIVLNLDVLSCNHTQILCRVVRDLCRIFSLLSPRSNRKIVIDDFFGSVEHRHLLGQLYIH